MLHQSIDEPQTIQKTTGEVTSLKPKFHQMEHQSESHKKDVVLLSLTRSDVAEAPTTPISWCLPGNLGHVFKVVRTGKRVGITDLFPAGAMETVGNSWYLDSTVT